MRLVLRGGRPVRTQQERDIKKSPKGQDGTGWLTGSVAQRYRGQTTCLLRFFHVLYYINGNFHPMCELVCN